MHLLGQPNTVLAPALVRYVPTIGPSVEGRNIPALVIGGTDDSPAIYFQATLHAREWITTSTVLYIASAMAESHDPRLRALVTAVRFYIVPVANPDGYVVRRPAFACWSFTYVCAMPSIVIPLCVGNILPPHLMRHTCISNANDWTFSC